MHTPLNMKFPFNPSQSTALRHIALGAMIASTCVMMTACGGSGKSTPPKQNLKPTPLPGPVTPSGISITNFGNNETIRYSLPILIGRTSTDVKSITLETGGKSYLAQVFDGNFKAVIPLRQGGNDITLSGGGKGGRISLNYAPANNPKKVRMLYAIAADDDGHFLAEPGVPNTMKDAKPKLSLQALLMQSATAEMLYKGTRQHVTYALMEDSTGMPLVTALRLPQKRADLLKMPEDQLESIVETALRSSNLYDNAKNMVILGFSDYKNGRMLGHTAKGGGNLAIFGGLHLHTCPSYLEQVSASFTNTTLIDTKVFPDDSAGRGTYWANCATGMGVSLQSLLRTFDVPLSPSSQGSQGLPAAPAGFMQRGFDNFNRLFMIREPNFPYAITVENELGAYLEPSNIDILLRGEWFKK